MAQFEALPVYKTVYDILHIMFCNTKNIPRDVKFTVVEKIKEELIQLLIIIYKANENMKGEERIRYILKAREILIGIIIRIRILYDSEYIGMKLYSHLSGELTSALLQLKKWQTYSRQHKENKQIIKETENDKQLKQEKVLFPNETNLNL